MANDVRLIDANSLMEAVQANDYMLRSLTNSTDRGMFTIGIQQAVDAQPTIDPESLRPKGHWNIRCLSAYDSWTQETDEEFYLECSECKREVWNIDQSAALGGEYRKLIELYPYCHCGCKMEAAL